MAASKKSAKKKTARARVAKSSPARKTRARSKSSSTAKPSTTPDRFAGEPRVYRFWQDAPGFLAFAGGGWKGEGVHGDPERDGQYKWTRVRVGADGIELDLLTARPVERPRGIMRFLFGPGRRPGTGGKNEALHFPAATLEADVDVVHEVDGSRRLDIQAIDSGRLYMVLRDTGSEGRIEFAGTITRA